LWWADFDPVIGHEQAGIRPALVVSAAEFNDASPGLVIVLPITSRDRGYESHVQLPVGTGGLTRTSYVLTDQIRAVSTLRIRERIGRVDQRVVNEIVERLRLILDL
jgi:mRNA interferase MazF